MNKILNLFKKEYVDELFRKNVLALYPDFCDAKVMKIKAHKDGIWEKTYHVVLEFTTIFSDKNGKKTKLPIFCTAHSEEPRRNVYTVLKFLWDRGFGKGYLTLPHPLFYSEYFRGTFYRGVEGKNLYQYIRSNDVETVEVIVEKAAYWFAKLHGLSTEGAQNFNQENSKIGTVFPGLEHILLRISENYPEHLETYKRIYDIIIKKENDFFNSCDTRWLVHGDAHPENIIKMGKKKIAVIDFTDLCLSDFTRDLGTFLQQLDYMCGRKKVDRNFRDNVKKIFLDSYFKKSNMKLDDAVQARIDMYYDYTAMRTATFFLLKDRAEPGRGFGLIEGVRKNL